MAKYIDAEKLIAEIKRRISNWSIREKFAPVGQGKDTCISRVTELSDLLSFIDSLQQEQPDCHTVEDWMQHIKNADQLTKDVFSKGPYDVLYDALNHPYQHCYDAIKEFGELCFQVGVNSVKQEQPDDLASLISEATNVAKRIIDRDSFYNSLPQNLRDKYTFKAWCEIFEALSMMKGKEQPEVDLDEEIEKELRLHYNDDQDVYWWNYLKNSFHHFYKLGRKQVLQEIYDGKTKPVDKITAAWLDD